MDSAVPIVYGRSVFNTGIVYSSLSLYQFGNDLYEKSELVVLIILTFYVCACVSVCYLS